MGPDLDNTVLLRVSYYRRPDGSVCEVRSLGDHIVWQGEVNLEILEWDAGARLVFVRDIFKSHDETRWPWEKRCTALVKCGPCALVLWRGGRVE